MALVVRLNTNRSIDQGDLNPIGMIISSMLTEAQFQALNGTSWVLAYGQNIAGSSYATITGNVTAPDLRGRVLAGKDNMGGSAANRLTSGGSGVDGLTIGASGGADTHTLSEAQMPAHTHTLTGTNWMQGSVAGAGTFNDGLSQAKNYVTNPPTSSKGSGSAHNNTQPTFVINHFIKIN